MQTIQTSEELNAFYQAPDPWGYEEDADDQRRRLELLGALPVRHYRRCLDIGCGNGFLTFTLPGDEVVGVDISDKAIAWANARRDQQPRPERFNFHVLSLFNLSSEMLGCFDLIVATGVFYDQYIGKGRALVRLLVDSLLNEGGVLASCHIRDWNAPLFPYNRLDTSVYPYRGYTHYLEVYKK